MLFWLTWWILLDTAIVLLFLRGAREEVDHNYQNQS